ncbi:MAG TPA: methyltransferase domain-containing protein [Candidatus Acidoferrales bacterium]|nr:methyltransferase domain-containing protein [Candidatus Acidoferrales bacterium]
MTRRRRKPAQGEKIYVLQTTLGTMVISLLPLLAFTAMARAQQTSMPPKSQDRPLDDRIASMERADRDGWQEPEEVVKAMDLKNRDVVADIGAETGYFSRRLAQAVAPDGRVYAVDVAADILAYLKERADRENLHNIVTVVSRPEDPMLPANFVDLAFFCDTTHHIEHLVDFFRKLFPAVKAYGRMAIIDFPQDSPHGPHKPEQLVPRSQVISEAEQAGFKFIKDFQFLPYHYFLIFEKQ